MTNPLDREYPEMTPKLPDFEPSEEIMQLVVDLNYAVKAIDCAIDGPDIVYIAQNLVLEAAKVQIVNQTVFTPDMGEE